MSSRMSSILFEKGGEGERGRKGGKDLFSCLCSGVECETREGEGGRPQRPSLLAEQRRKKKRTKRSRPAQVDAPQTRQREKGGGGGTAGKSSSSIFLWGLIEEEGKER